jgi:hypothetical protein
MQVRPKLWLATMVGLLGSFTGVASAQTYADASPYRGLAGTAGARTEFYQAIHGSFTLENLNTCTDGSSITSLFSGLVTFSSTPTCFHGDWHKNGTGGAFSQGGLLPSPAHQSSPITLTFTTPVHAIGADVFDDWDNQINVQTLTITTVSGRTFSVQETSSNDADTGFLGFVSQEGIASATFSMSGGGGGDFELDNLVVSQTKPFFSALRGSPSSTARTAFCAEVGNTCQTENFDGYTAGTSISSLWSGLVTFGGTSPKSFWGTWNKSGTGGSFANAGLLPQPISQSGPLVINFSSAVYAVGANVFDDFEGVNVQSLTVTTASGKTYSVHELATDEGDSGFLGIVTKEPITSATFDVDGSGANLEIDLLTISTTAP